MQIQRAEIEFFFCYPRFCLLSAQSLTIRFACPSKRAGCIAHRGCRGQSHHVPFCRCAWTTRESRLVHRARRQTRSDSRADPGRSRRWRSAAWESWSVVGAAGPRKFAIDRDERFVTIFHHRYCLPSAFLRTGIAESCREGQNSHFWNNNLSLTTMECARNARYS